MIPNSFAQQLQPRQAVNPLQSTANPQGMAPANPNYLPPGGANPVQQPMVQQPMPVGVAPMGQPSQLGQSMPGAPSPTPFAPSPMLPGQPQQMPPQPPNAWAQMLQRYRAPFMNMGGM